MAKWLAEWQPISTAPTEEGDCIAEVVLCWDGGYELAYYDNARGVWTMDGRHIITPTWWLPLKPPEEAPSGG